MLGSGVRVPHWEFFEIIWRVFMVKLLETSDIKHLEEYNIIKNIVQEMERSGILSRLQGNCVGACDLLSSMLLHQGIDSKIVECHVSVKNNNTSPPSYTFIGYDGLSHKEQIDVHTVVVTNTKNMLLIDLSIALSLTSNVSYIVGKVVSDPHTLGQYYFDGLEVRYNLKKNVKLPSLHQKSIIQRIKEEEAVKEKLRSLQIFVWIIAGFALVNFSLNVTQLIVKLLYL